MYLICKAHIHKRQLNKGYHLFWKSSLRSQVSTNSLKTIYFKYLIFSFVFFLFLNFIYLFIREGEGGRKKGGKHQCVVASWAHPTGNLACNPGMCSDWVWNWWPFGSQPGTQSTELHQLGASLVFLLTTLTVIKLQHSDEAHVNNIYPSEALYDQNVDFQYI